MLGIGRPGPACLSKQVDQATRALRGGAPGFHDNGWLRHYLTVKVYSPSIRCPSAATATHVTVYTAGVNAFNATHICFAFDGSTTDLPTRTR
jgi:hypothetical protein